MVPNKQEDVDQRKTFLLLEVKVDSHSDDYSPISAPTCIDGFTALLNISPSHGEVSSLASNALWVLERLLTAKSKQLS